MQCKYDLFLNLRYLFPADPAIYRLEKKLTLLLAPEATSVPAHSCAYTCTSIGAIGLARLVHGLHGKCGHHHHHTSKHQWRLSWCQWSSPRRSATTSSEVALRLLSRLIVAADAAAAFAVSSSSYVASSIFLGRIRCSLLHPLMLEHLHQRSLLHPSLIFGLPAT